MPTQQLYNLGSVRVGSQPTLVGPMITDKGQYADPPALQLKLVSPVTHTVTLLTYGVDSALVKDALGQYHYVPTVNEVGKWYGSWLCTGPGWDPVDFSFDAIAAAV